MHRTYIKEFTMHSLESLEWKHKLGGLECVWQCFLSNYQRVIGWLTCNCTMHRAQNIEGRKYWEALGLKVTLVEAYA